MRLCAIKIILYSIISVLHYYLPTICYFYKSGRYQTISHNYGEKKNLIPLQTHYYGSVALSRLIEQKKPDSFDCLIAAKDSSRRGHTCRAGYLCPLARSFSEVMTQISRPEAPPRVDTCGLRTNSRLYI